MSKVPTDRDSLQPEVQPKSASSYNRQGQFTKKAMTIVGVKLKPTETVFFLSFEQILSKVETDRESLLPELELKSE